MKFEPTRSNGRRDKVKRSMYFKESALNYCLIATELMLVYRMHAAFELWNDENSSNASRDTVEKVLCSAVKVPLIIYRSQPNLHHMWRILGKFVVWGLRKIPLMEAEIQPKRYLLLEMHCLQFFADRDQTYNISSARVESARYQVWRKISPTEAQIESKRYFVLKVKFP